MNKKIIGAIIEEEKSQSIWYKLKWSIIALISLAFIWTIVAIPILIYSIRKLFKKKKVEKIVNVE